MKRGTMLSITALTAPLFFKQKYGFASCFNAHHANDENVFLFPEKNCILHLHLREEWKRVDFPPHVKLR